MSTNGIPHQYTITYPECTLVPDMYTGSTRCMYYTVPSNYHIHTNDQIHTQVHTQYISHRYYVHKYSMGTMYSMHPVST